MCQTDNAKSLDAWAHTVPSSWSGNTQPLWVLRNASVHALPPACPESSPDLWTTAEILQALIYFVGLRNSTKRERLSVRLPTMGPLLFLGMCVDVFTRHSRAHSSISPTVQGTLNAQSSHTHLCWVPVCVLTSHFCVLCMQRAGSDSLPWLYMSGIQHGWWNSLILSLSWWNTNELVKTGSSGKQMNFSWCLKSCQIPSLKCFRGTSFW